MIPIKSQIGLNSTWGVFRLLSTLALVFFCAPCTRWGSSPWLGRGFLLFGTSTAIKQYRQFEVSALVLFSLLMYT